MTEKTDCVLPKNQQTPSGSEFNDLLSSFRRYRRALKKYPMSEWSVAQIEQWESDKAVFERTYYHERLKPFEHANDMAHEKMFLYCMRR